MKVPFSLARPAARRFALAGSLALASLASMLGGGRSIARRRRAAMAAVALGLGAAVALPAQADLYTDAVTRSRLILGPPPASVEHWSPVAAPVDSASLLESYPTAAMGLYASASSKARVGDITLVVDVNSYDSVHNPCCDVRGQADARGTWADNLRVFNSPGHLLPSGSLHGFVMLGSSISASVGSIDGIGGAHGNVMAWVDGGNSVGGSFQMSTAASDGNWNTFPGPATIPFTLNVSAGLAQLKFTVSLGAETGSYPGRDFSSHVIASAGLSGAQVDAVFDASGHALSGWSARSDSGHIYSPVPEPQTAALWLAGLAMVGTLAHRRRAKGG